MLYEIHMLKNYPSTNLNRDETGAPKTCYFGGCERGRISSQCLKRSWRTSPLFGELLGEKGIRSRKLPDQVADELKRRGLADDVVDVLREKTTGVANKEGKENPGNITSQIIFFSAADVSAVADAMERFAKDKNMSVKDLKKSKAKEIVELMKDVKTRPVTMDIALFGRMVTSDAFADVEAAVQTAHAFSTHAVNQESDYFTAVDDMVSGADTDDSGAGMIGDTDYNACCYYHYVSIDTDTLAENLKNSPDAQALIEKVLPCLVEVMACTNPSGKQNSFAGHVLPDTMCVEVKDRKVPVSYANAFADPVPFSARINLIRGSAVKLRDEIDMIAQAYGLPVKHRAWFAPRVPDIVPEGAEHVDNFQKLMALCGQWSRP